jgi:hypothetical protein
LLLFGSSTSISSGTPLYVRGFPSLSLQPETVLISILFTQKREQRCTLFYFAEFHVVCAVSPADCNILFVDIIRLLLMVPIYSWISLASYLFWVRSLVSVSGPLCRVLTPAMEFPRITLHPCFSSATHTRPSSSPLSSIFCSRICPRIPKCRRPYFANVVCQRKPTRNADGVGSPERSGSSLSDLSGGNRRCGGFLFTLFYIHAKRNELPIRMACSFCSL